MNLPRTSLRLLPLFLVLPLLLSGCGLFSGGKGRSTSLAEFRQVQSRYEQAATADNLEQGDTMGGQAGYAAVAATLTLDFIRGLPEDKLKPNAWMMRGVSEWRTRAFKPALTSAGNGISADPESGSRDHIMLLMLPALVADSEIVLDWQAAGRSFSPEAYSLAESRYQAAMSRLAQAESAFGPVTGPDTQKMFYLHKKRLLLNWDKMIRTLNADAETKKQTKAAAGAHLGVPTLFDAVIAVNNELARLSGS